MNDHRKAAWTKARTRWGSTQFRQSPSALRLLPTMTPGPAWRELSRMTPEPVKTVKVVC